jgi:hypothetical protein
MLYSASLAPCAYFFQEEAKMGNLLREPSLDGVKKRVQKICAKLKDISTPEFSTQTLNSGPFNPRLFNHELFNPMVQKFMVEKSGVEKFVGEKSGIEA